MDTEHMKNLYLELSELEHGGTTIWLEGHPSSSIMVTSQLCVHDEITYMRDYIFDEGVLKELHFDRISDETVNKKMKHKKR